MINWRPVDTKAPIRRPIRVLNSNVAERIAAGEVIERPAAVVKELIENSLDAGATEISVALEDGGKSLIEITDNGHGMSPEDLKICVLRHATSKLATLGDLEKIRSLGFRGEALPSVAAVAELSILSRTTDQETAYELKIPAVNDQERFEDRKFEPEPLTFGHFLNSKHGTRIQVRGLFAHVPARLKFLKSQGAEVGQVREWMERLALAHPECGFRLHSERRQILALRPQSETDRVRSILADGDDYPVVSAATDLGVPEALGLQVRVHWLQGLSTPQMRKIVQVVNGRAVRDRMLQSALLAPFRQALLPGQFPAVALYIDIDPAQIDVNVHPTKTEIRFLEGRKVFHAIDQLVDTLIAEKGAPAYAAGLARDWAEPQASAQVAGSSQPSAENLSWNRSSSFSWTKPTVSESGTPSGAGPRRTSEPGPQTPFQFRAAESLSDAPVAPEHPLKHGRFAGTLFNTYLFYELSGELALVDQHAAHERIRYEQLKKRALRRADGSALEAQALLIPEAVHFPAESRQLLESRLGWLGRLGFEAEVFGEDTLLFRGVPAEWGPGSGGDLRARLRNLVERVLAQDNPDDMEPGKAPSLEMDETLFEALASEACHSAIRAGDRLEREEAAALVEQLFDCEHPWNCPHGRPTVVRVPRARFEEWFQRRVP